MKNKEELKQFKIRALVGSMFYVLFALVWIITSPTIGAIFFIFLMFIIGGWLLVKIYKEIPEE